jgi:F-type H+-transporting ATPase subunit gamma
MAKAREIIKRRKSVANIRKITKTMEMIATSKFRKAFLRSIGARPYTEAIAELIGDLSQGDSEATHPLLHTNRDSGRTVLLVLTSNRGLCGGYNGNIIRLAGQQIRQLHSADQHIDVHASGKKSIQYFKFIKQPVSRTFTDLDDKIRYEQIEKLADEYIELYTEKKIDRVQVVYTKFITAARYYADVLPLLPLGEINKGKSDTMIKKVSLDNYIVSPSASEILEELIPAAIRAGLFQCFVDSVASEQVARMNAMKAATENSERMIQVLTSQYNRARQSQITGELLDIMGGVEALK